MLKKTDVVSGSAYLAQVLRDTGVPFAANDSIGDMLTDDDREAIQIDVQSAAEALLDALLIERDHNTEETAKRIAKMFVREVGSGRYMPRPRATDFPNAKGVTDPYTVGPVTIRSSCSHHFAPIMGKAWVAVAPGERVIGLSKFARVADWVFSRWQIQEEGTAQLAEELYDLIKPEGLAVVVQAQHFCGCWRGVRDDFRMTTTDYRGSFSLPKLTPQAQAAIDQITRSLA